MTAPLAYFFGDDDLMVNRAIGQFAVALADGGEPIERWDLRGSKNDATSLIGEIHGRVATPVMFGGGTIAVVANPGALAVKNEDRDALIALIPLVAPGNALVFVEAAQSGAKEPGQKKLAEAIRTAGGAVRRFESPKEGALAAWIDSEARDRDVRLAPGAAKELATRIGGFVREGDAERRDQTRRAAMELDKLALYRPAALVSVDDVRALVAEAVPGSAWALADAVAERDGARAMALFEALVQTMPEQVIVVVLHRRVRELLELLDRMPSSRSLAEVGRAMKINSLYRMERLATQARRWQPDELIAAIDGLLELDAVVKGTPDRPTSEAHRRLAFSLWIADHVGVSGARRPAPVTSR
ncbi:MAG TPA: DNA polymerase III subunit delta [Candidatus Limnocylindrales bacterium]|nr:DNA polymerase III subunit delta [Candidatus Limnocylindrales bacterium]